MHPAQIKAALTIVGYKQTDATEICGVTPTTIGAVLKVRSRSKQVEAWIAKATGYTPLELWSQWYGEGDLTLSAPELELIAHRNLSRADQLKILRRARGLSDSSTTGASKP